MRALLAVGLMLLSASSSPAQEISPVVDQGFVRSIRVIDGVVWIASDQGAARVRRGVVEPIVEDLRVNSVAAIGNEVWLGTESGLLALADGESRRLFDSVIGSFGVIAIYEADDVVLVGTTRGLFTVVGGDTRPTSIREPVYRIESLGDETLICTRRNLYRWKHGEPEALSDHPHTFVGARLVAGTIWALTRKGGGLPGPIFRLESWDPVEFVLTPGRPFSGIAVQALAEVRGEVFLGTTRGVRTLAAGDHLDSTTVGPELPINTIAPFQDGVLLGTPQGLFWQQALGGEFQLLEVEGAERPANRLNVKSITLDEDMAWLATSEGAYRVDLREDGVNGGRLATSLLSMGGVALILLLAIILGFWVFRKTVRGPSPGA